MEILKTDKTRIEHLSDNIIRFQFSDDAELDVAEMELIQSALIEYMKEKPYYILALPGRYTTITDEAKTIAVHPEKLTNRKAIAVVVKYLHHRLMSNFMIKVLKPDVPMRTFKTEEEAHKWLLKVMKQPV